jgi:flagellin
MAPLNFEAQLLKQEFGSENLEQLAFKLSSRDSSLAAIGTFQYNLSIVNSIRGKIGASQSRLDVSYNVLSVQQEQSRAAASRIQDADIGRETAELLRLSILQEAGAALLAQAGLQSELTLSLLEFRAV